MSKPRSRSSGLAGKIAGSENKRGSRHGASPLGRSGTRGKRGTAVRGAPSYETMHQTLFNAITEHHLPPGTKLHEDHLADAFGVSRTKIRTVLQQLNHDGMVDLHPYRGAFVAQPTVKDTREVFETRRILESGLIPEVIQHITPGQIRVLRDLLVKEAEAIRLNDRGNIIRYSGKFHIELCAVLGNDILTEQLRRLVARTSLIIAVYPPSGQSSCGSEHHTNLLDRIETKDVDGAIHALRQDLDSTLRSLTLEDEGADTVDFRKIVSTFAKRLHGE